MPFLTLQPTIDLSSLVGINGAVAPPGALSTPAVVAPPGAPTLPPVVGVGKPSIPSHPGQKNAPGAPPDAPRHFDNGENIDCGGLDALSPGCWLPPVKAAFERAGILLFLGALVLLGLYGLLAPSVNATVARAGKAALESGAA